SQGRHANMILALSEDDILEAVSIPETLDAVESAIHLYETTDFYMPPRSHVDYDDINLLMMPCFVKEGFVVKLVSVAQENEQRGLPPVNGVVVLNEAQTGVPIALLNGPTLTALRTGAVGAVSIRHLAPDSSHTLGVVGAGTQGYYQAWCAAYARKLTDITIYDRVVEKVPGMIRKLSAVVPGVRVRQVFQIEELLENSEIVIAATSSNDPVLPDNPDLLRGKHFAGIGSYKPSMREFPEALFKMVSRVFIDTAQAFVESGDLSDPLEKSWIKKEQVMTLGHFLQEGRDLETIKNETTLFKSVGMALFDLCVSRLVYTRAIEKQLGIPVPL
ncbi:MAG: ornithine cyclodeaminase family protein, partial [Omnitrophica WOR_2 bacterium]